MRQVLAPRMMVSPVRLSNTISSSSSPTRAPLVAPARKTPNKPRSGMVPPLTMATLLRALARGELAGDAVPGDARAQFGELVGGIAAGKHVEHAFECSRRVRPA